MASTRENPHHKTPDAPGAPGHWWTPLLWPFVALVVAGATWATFEFIVWNRIPAELVGKWVVVGGPQDGATFDFHRNGAMIGKINVGGNEGIIKATIRVKDNAIYSTTAHPKTGESLTVVQKIRTFSDNQLIIEDQRGEVLRMERGD